MKKALEQIDSSPEAYYAQMLNTTMQCYGEAVICCVLIILSVAACVLLMEGNFDNRQEGIL